MNLYVYPIPSGLVVIFLTGILINAPPASLFITSTILTEVTVPLAYLVSSGTLSKTYLSMKPSVVSNTSVTLNVVFLKILSIVASSVAFNSIYPFSDILFKNFSFYVIILRLIG